MLKQPHFNFSCFSGKKVHLGVSGSVAAYKMLELLRDWQGMGIESTVTLTKGALNFVTPLSFVSLGATHVYSDMFEDVADPFAHLAPGRNADAMLIAPATASTLARLATGSAEEMLAAQALAYEGPVVVAPAMHPRMWKNAATKDNWALLKKRGFICLEPEFGRTACGEEGEGRLLDLRELFLASLAALTPKDMQGQTVLLTMGPTREFWDGVRFMSNPSSGIMGAALAVAAILRGAQVKAVCGPGVPWLPKEVERHNVVSAEEMFEHAKELWPACSTGCFTAAVCDFKPAQSGCEKLKKNTLGCDPELRLQANPDILQTLATQKTKNQRVIAFAAETSNLKANALSKLEAKNADFVVGNLVGKAAKAGGGFESENNTVSLMDRSGKTVDLPAMSKSDVAWKIWDFFLQD